MNIKRPEKISSYFRIQKSNLAIIAVTGIIYNIGMTAGPYFEGRLAQCLYDIFQGECTWRSMITLAIIYICVIMFVQGNRMIKRFYVRRFANDTSKNMRHMIYNSIVHTNKSELDQEQMGSLMTKAISDVDACAEGMRKFTTEIFDTGIVLIAYIVMLLMYDARLTLLSCIFVPIAYVIAEKCKGIVTKYNEIYKKSSGRLNQSTMDLVGNALTYRVFGLEKNRQLVYENDLKKYENNAVKANVWESALQPVYYAISMCGAVLIFYYGGKNVMGTGWTAWDIGAFTTFFSCFTKLALKSSKAAKLFNAVQKASVSWKRIKPLMKEYVETEAYPEEESLQSVKLEHVDIGYSEQEMILHNITCEWKQGQIIGITGEIASGKSAVGKVFIDEAVYHGNIYMNGVVLKQMNHAKKNALVSYMGHEPELMSTSIVENIKLGKESGKLSLDECIKEVCMEQEIQNMPDGLHTMVGNGGICLSGGQQARVSMARCLYHGKQLLILDDPFSAVDHITEEEIFEQLREKHKQKLIILISHRLAMFPKMDGILYIHDGTATYGTHDQLMKTEDGYQKLYSVQKGVYHEQSYDRYYN